MKLCVPDYYKFFHCIASACQDNCCIGWEIDIDPESAQRYQQETSAFGTHLRASIRQEDGVSCFRMNGTRCALLNEQNLCDLILHLGETALCQICRDHPRFTDTFGGRRETGVGLCCEEAARLLFTHREPLTFCVQETEEEPMPEECDQVRLNGLLAVRETLFAVAQNRAAPMAERMCQLLSLGEIAQGLLEADALSQFFDLWQLQNGNAAAPTEPVDSVGLLQTWVQAFGELEAVNSSWTTQLKRTEALLTWPKAELHALVCRFRQAAAPWAHEWEQLVLYFLFRYFLKAVYTRDCLTPVQLAVVSALMIGLLALTTFAEDSTLSQEACIRTAVLYSKEVEYSEEALEMLEDMLIFSDCFSPTTLRAILQVLGKRD